MLSVRMRLVLLMVFISVLGIKAASIKKSMSESALKNEIKTKSTKTKQSYSTTTPKSTIPAIVAIEIVDGPENNSSAPKNTTKRTIESALGYGYNPSVFGPEPPKKFVIYKYSQQDIPSFAYSGGTGGGYNGQANIQKGLGYHVSSTSTHIEHQPSVELKPSSTPHYQPPIQQHSINQNHDQGPTTLYTTLTHQGQVGSLTNNVPYQSTDHSGGMVPVIILRIYSNQLTNPDTALHTNLPQSNPYSILNNINLQSLLQNYVHQYLQTQPQHYHQMSDYQQLYQGHGQVYQPTYEEAAPPQSEYHSNLPTSENYPSNKHTRVIFHSNNNGHIPESPATMYRTPGLSTYKTVQLPAYVVPQATSYSEADYAYTNGATQDLEQNYMYVYPNQDVSYQQEEKAEESNEPSSADPPFNYHAHPSGPARKQRSKKSNIEISSTLPPKRREPRT